MADGVEVASRSRCAACGTDVEVGRACPVCGTAASLDDRLAWISRRRREIELTRTALSAEDASLRNEALRLVSRREVEATADEPAASVDSTATPSLRATVDRRRWRAQQVGDLLLWVGGALLALSALSLAAVLWSRDEPAGRPLLTAPRLAVILLVATLVTAAITRLITRRRPATPRSPRRCCSRWR
jgi:hypothetical protein